MRYVLKSAALFALAGFLAYGCSKQIPSEPTPQYESEGILSFEDSPAPSESPKTHVDGENNPQKVNYYYPPESSVTNPSYDQTFTSSTTPVSVYFRLEVTNMWVLGSTIKIYLNGTIVHDQFYTGYTGRVISGYFSLPFGDHNFHVYVTNHWGYPVGDLDNQSYVPFHVVYVPPPPPAAPSINHDVENNHPKIYWSAVSGATGYKIYKSGDGSQYYHIDTISSTSFVDIGENLFSGSGNKRYAYYKVKAYNAGGDSPFSNVKVFTVEEPPY